MFHDVFLFDLLKRCQNIIYADLGTRWAIQIRPAHKELKGHVPRIRTRHSSGKIYPYLNEYRPSVIAWIAKSQRPYFLDTAETNEAIRYSLEEVTDGSSTPARSAL